MCMTPSSELHIYVVTLLAAIVIVVTQIHTTFPVPIWSNIITILLAFDHRILLIECSSFIIIQSRLATYTLYGHFTTISLVQ